MLCSSFIVGRNFDFLMFATHHDTLPCSGTRAKKIKIKFKNEILPNIKLNHSIHVILCMLHENCVKAIEN